MCFIYVYICLTHFLLIEKKNFSKIINNYRIVDQKNQVKNINDLTFQLTVALASIILQPHTNLNVFIVASKMSGVAFPFVNQNKKSSKTT